MKVDAVSTLTGAPVQSTSPQFSDRDKRDELAREVNRRKVEFPGQVRQGRLRQDQADRSKAIMHAIWLDYVAKVASALPAASETIVETPRQPLNSMAHAGDGDGAKTEAARVLGVDLGAGDDLTSHHVIAGCGDGEIGRPVRPMIDDVHVEMQPKYDSTITEPTAAYPTGVNDTGTDSSSD